MASEWEAVTLGPSPQALDDLVDRMGEGGQLPCASSSERTYTILTRWRSTQDVTVQGTMPAGWRFTVLVTDGRRAWTARDLSKPPEAQDVWEATAYQALTGKKAPLLQGMKPLDKKAEMEVKIEEAEEDGKKVLRISWSWKLLLGCGSEMRIRCPLGRPLDPIDDASAPRAISAVLATLIDSHSAVKWTEAAAERVGLEYSEYKAKEEERRRALLQKCTLVLNEKKKRIRDLQGRAGTNLDLQYDDIMDEPDAYQSQKKPKKEEYPQWD